MTMKILAFVLLVIGAVISYGAEEFVEDVIKKDDTDKKYSGMVKLAGFVLVLIGAIIIFKIG